MEFFASIVTILPFTSLRFRDPSHGSGAAIPILGAISRTSGTQRRAVILTRRSFYWISRLAGMQHFAGPGCGSRIAFACAVSASLARLDIKKCTKEMNVQPKNVRINRRGN
jgi:hypothetical protein